MVLFPEVCNKALLLNQIGRINLRGLRENMLLNRFSLDFSTLTKNLFLSIHVELYISGTFLAEVEG